MKIAAICGLVFTVIVFGGLRLLGGSGAGDTPAATHVIRHHPFGAAGAKTTPKTAGTHKTASKAHANAPRAKRSAARQKPVVDLAAVQAARPAGLPEPLAQALGR